MSSNIKPGVFTDAINHYFDVSLYLLVLFAFITLASSGGLDLPTGTIVGAALAFRGFFLYQRKAIIISERWTTPLTLAYFLFFAADYSLISRSFLTSTVHLALFAVVIRMFSLRRERDHLMLAILAFLIVLASAVLTVDSVFLFCFAGFMLMAVATFVLTEMRRSAQAAKIEARPANDPQQQRRLAIWLVRLAPLLMFVILAGAAALFFLLPRMSAGYMGAYSLGSDFSTGFTDEVRLGRIGEIQQSNTVVMHIQIDGDTDGHHDLHWRGVALSFFDGRSWSNPRHQLILEKQYNNTFEIPPFGTAVAWNRSRSTDLRAAPPREKMIHYRVLMEPIGTNVFFLAPWARHLMGNYRVLSADTGSAVHNLDSEHPINRYEAESDISTPSPEELRTSESNYPPQVVPEDLQLPVLDPRIPRLAVQIVGTASNKFDQATAIESYLRTHYGYTLQLLRTPAHDPLANFLFDRRQGHCEYFASAMAVMLRTLGTPARVVNGFRSDEFNDLTGNYVVRAKDAHAWVEAYFPGYGWQTFDPTPAGGSGTPQGWGRLALYLDAASSFWQDWVVSYDSSHQYVLGKSAFNETHDVWQRLRTSARRRYVTMLGWAKNRQEHIERSPNRWIAISVVIAILLIGLRNAGQIFRALHDRWLTANAQRLPEHAAAMWYERMARTLARRGVEKPAAQTPHEFLNQIEDKPLRDRVAEFTEAYESARFGKSSEDAQRLPELYQEVEAVQRK
jgi:protein-glutamine gamma-glutamyltransferase